MMKADPGLSGVTPGKIQSAQAGGAVNPDSPARQTMHTDYPIDPEFQLRGGFSNPMIDGAMPLFGLGIRVRTLDKHPGIEPLYKDVHNQISTLLEELRQHTYEPAHLLAFSYALCLYLDESVMGTPWGKNSTWSHQPLLSDFHQETWGGEKFFTVLSRMMLEPQRYQDVLEFMYVCLCIGLKGKYGIQPKGDEALQGIIVKLHRIIRDLRGPTPEQLSDPLTNVAPRNYRMHRQWPWWSPLVVTAVALVLMYGFFNYRLHLITTEVLRSLNGVLQ